MAVKDTRSAERAVVLFAMLFPAAAAWVYFILMTGSESMGLAYGVAKAIQFTIPAAWVLATSGESFGERLSRWRAAIAGLPWNRGLAPGLGSGGAVAVFLVGVHLMVLEGSEAEPALAAQLRARLAEIGAGTVATYAALAIFLSIFHSLLEEYYWRWFVFGRLRLEAGTAAAIAVSSLAFALHHAVILWYYLGTGPAAWLVWPFSAGVAAGGALWAWLYHAHGSLLPAWVSHALADIAIMGVGYALAFAPR